MVKLINLLCKVRKLIYKNKKIFKEDIEKLIKKILIVGNVGFVM